MGRANKRNNKGLNKAPRKSGESRMTPGGCDLDGLQGRKEAELWNRRSREGKWPGHPKSHSPTAYAPQRHSLWGSGVQCMGKWIHLVLGFFFKDSWTRKSIP